MICYHGSDTVVDAPKILEAKRPLDFGGLILFVPIEVDTAQMIMIL